LLNIYFLKHSVFVKLSYSAMDTDLVLSCNYSFKILLKVTLQLLHYGVIIHTL